MPWSGVRLPPVAPLRSSMRKMQGNLKSFDSAEHAEYDVKGKQAMLTYLNNKLKFKTIENSNRYGIDLLTVNEYNKVMFAWEIEVRHGNWQGDKPFPFREINCIERKDYQWRHDEEFFKNIPHSVQNNVVVYYVQLNKECNRAVIIRDSVILDHKLKPWANRKAIGEYVRQVPIEKTTQVRLT